MLESQKSVVERYNSCGFPRHGPHAKIIPLIVKGWHILDIGCGIGAFGRYLKKTLECYIVGMDIDRDAALTAKHFYDDIIIADVEKMPIVESTGFFNVVVMADVLEHLRRPDTLLYNLRQCIRFSYVIASLPNIGRLEVRVRLLLGKFEYQEVGILDKTHLRFFTLKSVKELFIKSGYRVIQIGHTGLASRHYLLSLFPSLFSYQFIIMAEPV